MWSSGRKEFKNKDSRAVTDNKEADSRACRRMSSLEISLIQDLEEPGLKEEKIDRIHDRVVGSWPKGALKRGSSMNKRKLMRKARSAASRKRDQCKESETLILRRIETKVPLARSTAPLVAG